MRGKLVQEIQPESESNKMLREAVINYQKAYTMRQNLKRGFKLIEKERYRINEQACNKQMQENYQLACQIASNKIPDFHRLRNDDEQWATIAAIKDFLGAAPKVSEATEHGNPFW